jgi:hypothetical protein
VANASPTTRFVVRLRRVATISVVQRRAAASQLGERRALGQDLPDEPGEEVLLHLANDPLDPLPFVLARYGRHARGRVPSIAAVSTQSGA